MPPPRPVLTVLVVDDDADMRAYLGTCLAGLGGVRVVAAADGAEALRLAQALAPDLVLTDVVLPRLDGLALCRALCAAPATAGIPLLVVSGEARTPPDCADGFLAKPFNGRVLRDRVRRLLPALPPPP